MERLLYSPYDLACIICEHKMSVQEGAAFLKTVWQKDNTFLQDRYRDDLKRLYLDVAYCSDYLCNKGDVCEELFELNKEADFFNKVIKENKFEKEAFEINLFFKSERLKILYINQTKCTRLKLKTMIKKFGYERRSKILTRYINKRMIFYHMQAYLRGNEKCNIEDINLDDDNNKYFKTLPKITPTKLVLETNKNLTGTKDGQVAIKASISADNEGTIKLTGKDSVALFSKKSISNQGSIEVAENSIAQYTVFDTSSSDNKNKNERTITLGKSSTGIRMNRDYNNIGGLTVNSGTGKILSTAEKVTGIIAYTVDKRHIAEDSNDFSIENYGEINLLGDKSTGIYVAGKGPTEMDNNGKIIIGASSDRNNPSIGMFSTNSENDGENAFSGTIEVGKNSIGMAGINGEELSNEGTITIKGDGGVGMYLADGTEGSNEGTIKTDGVGLKDVIGVIVGKNSKFTNEASGKILINSANGKGVVFEKGAVVVNNGVIKVNGANATPEQVTAKSVTLKALSDRMSHVRSDLGIYMNSLGKTNPIEGLS